MKHNVVYSGILLTLDSQADLLSWWTDNIGPLLENEIAHHMTIQFKPSWEDVVSSFEEIGSDRVYLTVLGYVNTPTIQAVAVTTDVKSNNTIPHITVAIGGDGKAFQSNAALEHGMILLSDVGIEPIELSGNLMFFNKGKEVVGELPRLPNPHENVNANIMKAGIIGFALGKILSKK